MKNVIPSRSMTIDEKAREYERIAPFAGMGFMEWMGPRTSHGKKLQTAEDAAKFMMRSCFVSRLRESFWILPLMANLVPVCRPVEVSRGMMNTVVVGAAEFYQCAVWWNASAVFAFHNHPCGETTPSAKDWQVTDELAAAGRILHIPLLDHIVVTANGSFCSLKESEPQKWNGRIERGFTAHIRHIAKGRAG